MSSATTNPAHTSDSSPTKVSVPPSQPPPNTPQKIQSDSRHNDLASGLEKLSLKGSDTRRSAIKTTPSYTRSKRQRKDRDVSQHLLTPPLTPSSSIRTTESADSAEGKSDDKAQSLRELQEPEATHFIYVRNSHCLEH
jgi:hypothetical protein